MDECGGVEGAELDDLSAWVFVVSNPSSQPKISVDGSPRRMTFRAPPLEGPRAGGRAMLIDRSATFGLITRRSQVQILPPLLERPWKQGLFVVVVDSAL